MQILVFAILYNQFSSLSTCYYVVFFTLFPHLQSSVGSWNFMLAHIVLWNICVANLVLSCLCNTYWSSCPLAWLIESKLELPIG